MPSKKKMKIKKPSRLEELTLSTKNNFSHQHSATVQARHELLHFEARQVEDRIVSLQSALAQAKNRKAELNAMIVGLNLIMEKR